MKSDTQFCRTTGEFWRILDLKNLKTIRKIWETSNVKLKDEKTFLQVLMIIAILSKRYCRKKFKLVFDHFGSHFGINKLYVSYADEDEDSDNYWALSKNERHDGCFLGGTGNIERKLLRVGFVCSDCCDIVNYYEYPSDP